MNPTRPNTCSALFLVIWPCLANAQDLGWVERIGGSFLDRAAMATDATGNIYLAGNLNDEVDFDPGPAVHSLTEAGMGDLFIAKYDPSGNYLWAERIGGAGLETVRALAVAGNGDLFISGGYAFTTDFDPGPDLSILGVVGGDEGYLAKYDTDGVLQWVNGIIGEGYFDLFTNLTLFNSGDVLVTGAFIGPLDFDPGLGTVELTSAPSTAVGFMARYAGSTGALVWAGALDDPDGDMIRSAAIDAQGDIYVAGEFSGTMDADPSPALAPITVNDDILFVMQDIFFAKYDGNGSFVWVERIGGPDSEGAAAIQLDGSGHLYVTGQGAPLMDMDPGPDTVALSASVFIAKYDNMGEYEWAYAYEGYEGAPSLRVDPVSGSLVVNGAFSIPVDLDLGPTTFILDPYGNLDFFIARYDTAYTLLSSMHIGTAGASVSCVPVCFDPAGELVVSGSFTYTVDFDPGPGTSDLTAPGGLDIFLSHYEEFITSVPQQENPAFHLYPNPCRNKVTVEFAVGNSTPVQVSLLDVAGHKLRDLPAVTCPMGSCRAEIDLEGVRPGTYLVNLLSGERSTSYRVVRQ